MEHMDKETNKVSILERGRLSRRDMLRAGGVAALGLAFAKPVINTIAPPPVYASISPVAPPPPILAVACTERPFAITFVYTGAVCAVPLANPQLGGKNGDKIHAFCTDGPSAAGPGPVEIRYTGKDSGSEIIVTPVGTGHSTGETITATTNNTFVLSSPGRVDRSGNLKGLHSTSTFDIVQNGNIIQQLEIHTSCSKPLNVGDQFGSLRVVDFTYIP